MPERTWVYSSGCPQGLTHGLVSSTCSVDVFWRNDRWIYKGSAKIWGWVRHYYCYCNNNITYIQYNNIIYYYYFYNCHSRSTFVTDIMLKVNICRMFIKELTWYVSVLLTLLHITLKGVIIIAKEQKVRISSDPHTWGFFGTILNRSHQEPALSAVNQLQTGFSFPLFFRWVQLHPAVLVNPCIT